MSPVSAPSPVSAQSPVSAPSPVSTPSTASAPSTVSALTRSLYNSIPLIHDNVESYILSTTSHNPSTHFSAVPTYLHIFQSSHAFLRPLPISHSFSPDLLRGSPRPHVFFTIPNHFSSISFACDMLFLRRMFSLEKGLRYEGSGTSERINKTED